MKSPSTLVCDGDLSSNTMNWSISRALENLLISLTSPPQTTQMASLNNTLPVPTPAPAPTLTPTPISSQCPSLTPGGPSAGLGRPLEKWSKAQANFLEERLQTWRSLRKERRNTERLKFYDSTTEEFMKRFAEDLGPDANRKKIRTVS